MGWWGLVVTVIVVAVAVTVIRGLLFERVTIYDYQRGVRFSRGQLRDVLGSGVYWVWRPFQSVQVIDLRSQVLSVGGQEVLSADNVSVKASVALRFRVAAPERVVQNAQAFHSVLHLEVQLILRDMIGAIPIEELLQRREQLAVQLRDRLEPKATELGVTLETVGIKDITFPGNLKQIFAQVVEARKAAQASLEKARGETATLRHLANAARLLEGNPALVTLKTLQAASDGKHTLVLGLSQPVIPLPKEAEISAPPKPSLPSQETPPTAE